MNKLDELRLKVLHQGSITQEEIDSLKSLLYEDGGMTIAKGNTLFEIKENIKGKAPASFKRLFVDSITKFLLEDENSPGRIERLVLLQLLIWRKVL